MHDYDYDESQRCKKQHYINMSILQIVVRIQEMKNNSTAINTSIF